MIMLHLGAGDQGARLDRDGQVGREDRLLLVHVDVRGDGVVHLKNTFSKTEVADNTHIPFTLRC